MKKYIVLALIIVLFFSSTIVFAWGKKKQEPVLILTSTNPAIVNGYDNLIDEISIFQKGQKIYFSIYNPKGFNSDYIKYQIVKQDDKAYVGGFTRIRNVTKRLSDKNSYTDYFVIHECGKYYLQIFDITNLHHYVAIGAFKVVDE